MGHKRPPVRQRPEPFIKQRARELRHHQTEAESLLWRAIRGEQLDGYKFRRQQTIGAYIVDFISLDAKLIVELDGGQHADAVDYDAKRDTWLESEGFRVLRFWNNDVMENLEGVLMTIAAALSPPPQPSPLEGEGDKRAVAGTGKGDKLTATPEVEGRTR